MDFIWVLIAFAFGFLGRQVGLPPLIGYLLAGFVLNALGFQASSDLEVLANLGITLMLFTIGLKLNVQSLIKPEILVVSLSHTMIWSGVLLAKWLLLSAIGIGLLNGLELSWQATLLALFALSFSSTVCVMKVLEDQDEIKSKHGRIAIGILVVQDIIAVLFLAIATGKVPSIWAVLLLLLIPARPLLNKLLEKAGHGELLILAGMFLALGGSELFYSVNIKGDFGALVMGMLLASYPKSSELYKSLVGFKDLFLIGFFLSIGFTALPTTGMVFLALAICLLLALKFFLFLFLFLFFKMRSRNAFLSAVTLTNFSEFGLIVADMAVDLQWFDTSLLVVITLSMAFSLIISSIFSKQSHRIYARYQSAIDRLQWQEDANQYELNQPASVRILIMGLGRVGISTFKSMNAVNPGTVLGIDSDEERIKTLQSEGMQVVLGDGEDVDFWSKIKLENVELIMLVTPGIFEMKSMIELLKTKNYSGRIACISRFEDERQQLLAVGADVVFNYFEEVGAGYAEEGRRLLAKG